MKGKESTQAHCKMVSERSQASHYDILGVSETASKKDIRKSWRALIRKHHPDKNTNGNGASLSAESYFHEIQDAYSILSDPTKRAVYDSKLAAEALTKIHDSLNCEVYTEFRGGQCIEETIVQNQRNDSTKQRTDNLCRDLFNESTHKVAKILVMEDFIEVKDYPVTHSVADENIPGRSRKVIYNSKTHDERLHKQSFVTHHKTNHHQNSIIIALTSPSSSQQLMLSDKVKSKDKASSKSSLMRSSNSRRQIRGINLRNKTPIVQVLITGFESRVTENFIYIVEKLGGKVLRAPRNYRFATHIIAPRVLRTEKFLVGISNQVKQIVNQRIYILIFINEEDYILKDEKWKEKLGFNISEFLRGKGKRSRIFSGHVFYVCKFPPNIPKLETVIKRTIRAGGGKVVLADSKCSNFKNSIIIIAPADLVSHETEKFKHEGFKLYTKEAVFMPPFLQFFLPKNYLQNDDDQVIKRISTDNISRNVKDVHVRDFCKTRNAHPNHFKRRRRSTHSHENVKRSRKT